MLGLQCVAEAGLAGPEQKPADNKRDQQEKGSYAGYQLQLVPLHRS